jgi:hypothetical protein
MSAALQRLWRFGAAFIFLAVFLAGAPAFSEQAGAPASGSKPAIPQAEGGGWHRHRPGDRLVYLMEYRNVTTTDMRSLLQGGETRGAHGAVPPGFQPQTLITTVKGTLNLLILDRRAKGFLVSYDFPDAEVVISTNGLMEADRIQKLGEALREEILADIDPSGRIGTLRFLPGSDPLSRGVEKALLAWTQFSAPDIPPAKARRWEVVEEDPSGRYVAEYRLSTGKPSGSGAHAEGHVSFRKRKLKYLAKGVKRKATHLEVSPSFQPSGETTVTFNLQDGCLETISGKETMDAVIRGHRVARSRTTVHLRLLKQEPVPSGEYERRRGKALASEAARIAEGMAEQSGKREAEIAQLRQELGDSTADDLISRLLGLGGSEARDSGDTNLMLKLRAMASLDPEACRKIGKAIFSRPAGTAAFRLVARSYMMSGSVAAQEALVAATRARRSDPDALFVLITSLAQVDEPTMASVEAIGEIAFDPSARDEDASLAILAYGAMARHLEETDPSRADKMVDRLLAGVKAAPIPGQARTYIAALGNAGSARALPELKRLLSDPKPDVRGTALMAIRNIEASEADQLLFQALASDPESTVREAAARALAFREMTASRFQAQEAAIRKEKEASIRIVLLNNLWHAKSLFPSAKRIVGEAARKDPSPDVRKHAAGLLAKPADSMKESKPGSGKR